MFVKLTHTIPITIIAAYAPTSVATKANKDQFYKTLKQTIKSFKNNILHVFGDFNARIQIKLGPHEECIGEHTFDKENALLENQSTDIADNRRRFLELAQKPTYWS